MTFEVALKRVKAKFEEVDASKLADMAVQVTLTDEDCGGTLYFKVADGTVDVQGYDYRDNDAVLDIERKALMDILSGRTTLDKAIEKGKATAKGNFEKLDTLKDAVKKAVPEVKETAAPEKKPAARKTASKKSEVKDTVKKAAVGTTAAKSTTTAKKTAAKSTAAKKATRTSKKSV